MNSLDPQQLQELKQISDDKVKQVTYYFFTVNHVILFLAFYVMAKLLEIVLKRIDSKISPTHMRNCVTYILQIIFTTAGLVILIMIHRLYGKDWTYRDYRLLQLATLIIMDLEKLDVSPEGIALLFQATTEQATFVGLLFYRIKPNWAKVVLRFSTFQVLIAKLGTLAWCYFMWKRDMIGNYKNSPFDKAWDIIFPIVGLILVWTQIWSTYVVWVISSKKKPEKNLEVKGGSEKESSATEVRSDNENESSAIEVRRNNRNKNSTTDIEKGNFATKVDKNNENISITGVR
ncbi:8495_t:CDS:2 [Acaulospora morrowiae]|uniref:8495_t:CDS:1 n=1 Tax=Acaulospora morrowiae TaxID=94023 RepID=A0A9N8V3T9_9GLOM|nr:8495_t:CDS:2 [Acaulospora morrowiae]